MPTATIVSIDLIAQMIDALPSLPAVATKIIRLVDDPKTNAHELVEVVRAEPALTARILKMVNSALFGLQCRVGTLDQAIPLIGFNTLKQLCAGIWILDNLKHLDPSRAQLEPDAFWQHTFATACAAKLLAPHFKVRDGDEAFVTGLLHDLGKLVLAEFLPQALSDALERARRTGQSLHLIERELLGTTHALIGGALVQNWDLPARHVAAVRFHHGGMPEGFESRTFRQLAALTALANVYVKALEIGDSGCPKRQKLPALYTAIGIRTPEAQQRLEQQIRGGVSMMAALLRS